MIKIQNIRKNPHTRQFFLPWQSGYITKLKIPHPTTGKMFATSSLSGCSVFVAPPANSPTVYHCGISDPVTLADALTIKGEHRVNKAVRQAANQNKSHKFWWALLKQREGVDEAKPIDCGYGEVKPKDYKEDGTQLNRDGKKFLLTSRLKTMAEHYFQEAASSGRTIDLIGGAGFVFGKKQRSGAWEFYLQENAEVTYIRRNGTKRTKRLPIRITRFFPPAQTKKVVFRARPLMVL